MAQFHVNSTGASPAATPTAPYDTWAKAAATLAAVLAVPPSAGDEIFIHPSHVDTAGGNTTWPGTPNSPNRIICGTPGATSGVTALQNTAIWGLVGTASNVAWAGSFYAHGITFRLTGSSGSCVMTLNSTTGACSVFSDCQFQFSGAGGATIVLGSGTGGGSGITVLDNCGFRWGAAPQFFRLVSRVVGRNLYVVAGSVTPTLMFSIGNTTLEISSLVRIDGFDFSSLTNTVRLVNTFGRISAVRINNVKCPTGWGVPATPILSADLFVGSELEILNYGDGDTNHRYWIEDKQGRATAEDTIKVSSAQGSGNPTATYSKRLTTLSTTAYPSSVYRGPPISKYVEANGQYKGIYLYVNFDGAARFTNKEFWIEASFRGTNGQALGTVNSSLAGYLATALNLNTTALATWAGATGTGPNGSSTWNACYAYVSITPYESGWVTLTPCFAVPSKTIFINDDFTMLDEGALP